MIEIFLRFPDAATAIVAFAQITGQAPADLADVPSKVEVNGLMIDIAVCFGNGIVTATHETAPTGETDAETGEPILAPTVRSGFHVNLLLPDEAVLPGALEAVRVHPAHPALVFLT